MKLHYGSNIHVVGIAGTEGAALLNYLYSRFPKANITAHNAGPQDQFLKHFRNAHVALERSEIVEKGKALLELDGVKYCFDEQYLDDIADADTIFVPQSWYLYEVNKPLESYQDKFCSITKLYFDLFPGKIIGVTGSNGKTTTTTLIAEIMQRAYPSTLYSGNDRRASQILDELEEANADDWLVLEISNRQLKFDLGKSPDVSVITNITPNHLNEYRNFAEYAKGKASLLQYQTEDQWSVLNQDDPESRKLIERDGGETMPFSTAEVLPRGVFVQHEQIILKHADQEEQVMAVEDFPLLGKHNLSNALAAIAATHLAGIETELIAQTLRSTDPVPQRMELVDTVDGVTYYNDSASTVPESTIAAIQTLKTQQHQLILIMGGSSKGSDYEEFAQGLDEHVDHVLFLESPVASEVKQMIDGPVPIVTVESLKEAVEKAHELAQEGDVVLFSPAAEYFVYFKDKMPGYKNFRHIVAQLKG